MLLYLTIAVLCSYYFVFSFYLGTCSEYEVFSRFYARLVAVLSVTSFSHHLVSARILTTDEEERLESLDNRNKRAAFVLRKVAVHLNSGNSKSFHSLLSVIETYGDISSVCLVSEIKSGFLKFTGSQVHYWYCNKY